jgi:hypothetical protein
VGGPGGYSPYGRPEQGHGARPPYLASETNRRASAPVEPWAEALKTLMLVFGVLLIACFVAPWRVMSGQTVFSWTLLGSDMPVALKIIPILLAATGVMAVVLGALPMSVLPRGFAAAGIGLAPIVYGAVTPSFEWQGLLSLVGAVTLVSGLLVRSQYTGALAGRIMATIGAICVLLPLLIPDGGQVPLVGAMKALGSNQTVPALALLVPALLALVAMIVWLPPPTHAGAHIAAWLFIVWPLVTSILLWLNGGHLSDTLRGGLDTVLYLPIAAMAWAALAGYGVASVVGKQLEHA